MKISKEKLKQIIKEELEASMEEGHQGTARKFGKAPAQDIPHLKQKGHHPDYPPKEVSDEEKHMAIYDMIRSHYPNSNFKVVVNGKDIMDTSEIDAVSDSPLDPLK